ncbi:DUF4097 family beta strand repeat-containing protein [Chengkuizengella sediminis]|uniref:DUF4097 family beta strand repeat-containing protein n=1 Tax=Chengkuizengella sediminis TaxID=1885917 RepID=UPI001389600A|nr:DUF4097 family beta strand repeat-containing protein [Chengkuizengella sediminis]NDI35996.1 DUF4097 domain-containing protein [Chengkuizengella sediminis]
MKKFAFLGIILIIVGAVGAFVFIDGAFETVDIFEEKIASGNQYKNIEIDTSSVDVNVIPTDKEELRVMLSGEVSSRYEEVYDLVLKEMGDTLQIELKEKNIFFNVGFVINNVDLQVEIPQKLYDSFKVDVTSGDIEVAQLQANGLILSTSSGDVKIEELNANDVELTATSGNISAKNGVISSNILIETSSGDIDAENIITNILTMEVTSGNIEFTNNTVKTSNLQTSSGNITIYNDELKGDIKAKTTSGDITIDLEQENESLILDFKTSSGDVDIRREGYLFEEKSDSRAIGKMGSGKYNIEARASSGDITLK